MPVEYPFRNYLFLFGASAKAEVVNYVRTQCTPAEQDKLDETLAGWVGANKQFRGIEQTEIGKAEQITLMDIPEEFSTFLKEVEDDFLFKQSFSLLPYEVKLVEIDKLVASQRAVNLDYVEILKKRVSPKPTIPELISFCLAPPKDITPPAEQILAQNVHSYTSENLDFRFLGGFQKPLSASDLQACVAGGFPLAAIVLLVGLGSSSMNCLAVGNRIVLNNGFHRAYTLRSMGVTHAPLVVQHVANPQLEVPPVIADLPREYLLGAPRPALIMDFFNPNLATQFKVKARNKVVQVQWAANQFALPIVG